MILKALHDYFVPFLLIYHYQIVRFHIKQTFRRLHSFPKQLS